MSVYDSLRFPSVRDIRGTHLHAVFNRRHFRNEGVPSKVFFCRVWSTFSVWATHSCRLVLSSTQTWSIEHCKITNVRNDRTAKMWYSTFDGIFLITWFYTRLVGWETRDVYLLIMYIIRWWTLNLQIEVLTNVKYKCDFPDMCLTCISTYLTYPIIQCKHFFQNPILQNIVYLLSVIIYMALITGLMWSQKLALSVALRCSTIHMITSGQL